MQIKYGEQIHSFPLPTPNYSLDQLLSDASTHFQVDKNLVNIQIIHGAHPLLTQQTVDTYLTNSRSVSDFLDANSEDIHQPFLEIRPQQDFEAMYQSKNRRSEFHAVIGDHLATYCLRDTTLRDVMKHLLPDLSDDDLDSSYIRKQMKLIYPNLLRFQCTAPDLLSTAQFDFLGSSRHHSLDQVSQTLTPIFVDFFARTDKISWGKLRAYRDRPREASNKEWYDDDGVSEKLANLCDPHLWYPLARQMKRKIILHVGPTNSGKTHSGLEALKKAPSGIYCGPLRLLAQEIYDRFQGDGIPTNLLTGQLRHVSDESSHLSCTVEMAPTDTLYHCAVLDEIQMISDPDRGWAWTRVLLGIPAKEIHLCGNETVIDVIREIVASCGDELEVKTYKRLSPLKVPEEPLETIYDLRRGDCIIAFSRSKVYAIKNQIERELKQKCCIVYGRLPPETRFQQAKLFNTSDNDYPFLVATDAIGMGLNLNIKRVVFSTLEKFDGKSERKLTPSELKQIAGRAGRYKSVYPVGYATSFDDHQQRLIRHSVDAPLQQSPFAGILPAYEQIELFALGTQAEEGEERYFSEVLSEFTELATVDNEFFLCGFDSMMQIAKAIDEIPLRLKDRYVFCLSPCQTSNPFVMRYLKQYAYQFSLLPTPEGTQDVLPSKSAKSDNLVVGNVEEEHHKIPLNIDEDMIKSDLEAAENVYAVLDLYLWLSWRFSAFSDRGAALMLQQICNDRIEASLKNQQSSLLKNRRKKKKESRRSGKRYK